MSQDIPQEGSTQNLNFAQVMYHFQMSKLLYHTAQGMNIQSNIHTKALNNM
jgi:hypothetical protein